MNTSCPLCSGKSFKPVYSHFDKFPLAEIVSCTACGHVYTRLAKEMDKQGLYSENTYKLVDTRKTLFDKIIENTSKKIIRRLDKLNKGRGRLLDFGAGKGKFASIANLDGWTVTCVETADKRAAFAKKVYGLDVISREYTGGVIAEKKFDVICLFHVLEHLQEPRNLLNELVSNNLIPDKWVIIEVPNFKSWQSKWAGQKWLHLDPYRHCSHFTPERMDAFAATIGLIPVKSQYYSFHLGVLGMIDCFMQKTGYKKNIIYELKNSKSFLLRLKIMALLPFAVLVEWLASKSKKGGITRKYYSWHH